MYNAIVKKITTQAMTPKKAGACVADSGRRQDMEAVVNIRLVEDIVDRHGNVPASLIAVLQDIQQEYRYVPEAAMEAVAARMDIPSAKIYSVATFYENFSLEPKGKHVIKICDGTACHVRKSIPILNELKKMLALEEGQHTTRDGLFTLETVSCLGACGLAPVFTINDKVYAKMSPETARDVIAGIRGEELSC
jgi:NADH-quinone oxidoreductase subunit E